VNEIPSWRRRRVLQAAALLAQAPALAAWAQMGRKPLSIVVGFPAGGPADAAARLMAEALRGPYGGPVLVDNRPGAGGRIAIDYVRNAEPDGTALLLVPGTTMTLSPHLYRQLSFNPARDFTPVAPAFGAELALAIGPSVPASVRTVRDFVQWGKANPQELFFGVGAQGSLTHYLGIMFAKAAGVEFTYVPYKGGAEVMRDLLGGRVATTFMVQSEALGNVKAGRLRVLATAGAKRSPLQPEVPTLVESGVAVESNAWFGYYVGSRTPPEIVQRLAELIAAAQGNASVQRGFAEIGYTMMPATPAAFAAQNRAEFEHWRPIAKASGIVLD